jgi:LmbE family N-acetylglucosaminyl deacetylase
VAHELSKRERAVRGRLVFYGGLLALLWGFYVWQPYEFDLIPRKPDVNPPADPESDFLFSGKAKVLIVTAHPDDSSFFIGGLLTRLADVHTEIHQVICTDGDKGYYPFEDWQKNRRVRRIEALEEAAAWGGKDILFLGQPDGRMPKSQAIVNQIERAMLRVKPDYVLCFDGEYPDRMSHRDHRASGEMAMEAARLSGIPKWVLMFQTSAPNHYFDITNQWDAQQDLLAIHKSQFYGDHLLGVYGMVGGRAERDGSQSGFSMAEGLRCVRLRE